MLHNSKVKNYFSIILNTNGLSNETEESTHFTIDCTLLIDMFMMNIDTVSLTSGVISSHFSGYLSIFLATESLKGGQNLSSCPRTLQNIMPTTLNKFQSQPENLSSEQVLNATTADDADNRFILVINKMYCECFPFKTIKKQNKV